MPLFFQGSLQEGIAAALQEAKTVLCFVTDGEAESQLWENDFLAEEEIHSLLQSRAVTLRLPAGSQEEGFLAQLYPLPKKPTVVMMRKGELCEYIAAGVAKDEFVRRVKAALAASQPAAAQPAAPQLGAPPAAPGQPSHTDESSAASSSGQATPPTPSDSRVQSLLAERAAKLAEKKKKDEEEAKRHRAEKAKAKAEAEASGMKKPDEQSKHVAALKKKQEEARKERQRILKAIEDDKAARRAQKAEAEAERKAAAAAEKPASAPFAPASQLFPSTGKLSGHCSLQVRLFDGSTIRSRFSSNETLKDVRTWVDQTRKDGNDPYTFKVLVTPLPSKTIDVIEEGRSLQELELAPSSTLILVRAPKHTPANTSPAGAGAGHQGNIFQRLIAYIVGIITGFFGTIYAFFSTIFSTAGPPPATSEPTASRTSQSQTAADVARRRRGRVAGLDQTDERGKDQQFYNGNSTNFEPRTDDGE
ncbi:UBX domain-containing protein 4 [Achaetomium macrosporum]|uniref:UBX domain-containing protein 2 n=1 Tax=Achaetomium macrosporum TaxID=79813 RepID=A0AAN7CC65_9PEZI|nr:UBX domain-containing protein 4 [Achaetomium macrosporum]